MTKRVFVTGGTGYIGSRLANQLVGRGFSVTALVRQGSESKLPAGCNPIQGSALDGTSYETAVCPGDTFVQLVGVAHPGPGKEQAFQSIDRQSAMEAIAVAQRRQVSHFIYLSVAQPAPVMRAYVAVRSECEAFLRRSGLNATVLRPWYVLGPNHRWPAVLLPFYKAAELLPRLRDGARRLGLVSIDQMVAALIQAVETPASGIRIVEVPEIRRSVKLVRV